MMEDKRIKYYTPADYTEGSELDKLVKTIIDTTASNEKLMAVHYINKQEQVRLFAVSYFESGGQLIEKS